MEAAKVMSAVDLLNRMPILEETGQENYLKAWIDTDTNYPSNTNTNWREYNR